MPKHSFEISKTRCAQEEKMNNVLYIHGFNGSPDGSTGSFVKEYFREGNVVAPKFDLLDCEKTLAEVKQIIHTRDIRIVVAQSLGAFYALAFNSEETIKIVVNPCMLPSVEIPPLSEIPVPENIVSDFRRIEEKTYSHVFGGVAQTTFGIFGDRDELFSYLEMFKKIYGTNSLRKTYNFLTVSGSHSLPKESLKAGIDAAMSYAEVFKHLPDIL